MKPISVAYLITVAVTVLVILSCFYGRYVRRLYYAGKAFFRGKYFHEHYVDTSGKLNIVYRTTIGERFWTLMGKIYSAIIVFTLLFLSMVRFHGTEGYTLLGTEYKPNDVVTVFDYEDMFCVKTGTLISSGENIVIENDTGTIAISGFVIGKYYEEELTVLSAPGLLVRSTIANTKVLIQFIQSFF